MIMIYFEEEEKGVRDEFILVFIFRWEEGEEAGSDP
jgi:hypothetical protein